MQVFWTDNQRNRFRKNLVSTMQSLRISYALIANAITIHVSAIDGRHVDLDERTVRRFVKEPEKPKPDSISTILIGISEYLLTQTLYTKEDSLQFLDIINQYTELMIQKAPNWRPSLVMEAYYRRIEVPLLSNKNERSDHKEFRELTVRPRTDEERKSDIETILLAFSRASDSSKSVEGAFFSKNDGSKIFFVTFRFTGKPGVLKRSFTVVHRPTVVAPIVRFANFYDDKARIADDGGTLRRSDGIAIAFKNETVFVGHTDSGGSLKVMNFKNLNRAKKSYEGILLTNDPDEGPLAARFVMLRTESSHHSEIETGDISIEAVEAEIGPELLKKMRNNIEFSLEAPVFNAQGKSLHQRDMVKFVGRALMDGETPLLVQDGRAFNPADARHYTFNSALLRG